MVSQLMNGDDIIFISDSPKGLQKQLDILHRWSNRWHVSVKIDKTKVIHFRKASDPCTNFCFKLGEVI